MTPLTQILLVLLSSGLLSVAYLDSDYFLLTWVAFVPLLFAIEQATLKRTYLLGLLMGICTYANGMYWIVDFAQLSKGFTITKSFLLATLFWLYCGQLVALASVLYKWLKKHTKITPLLLFPVTFTVFISKYPMLFSMHLGNSQTSFTLALQGIEISGVYGLDVVICLVNMLVFQLCLSLFYSKRSMQIGSTKALLVSYSLVILWFSFGVFQYSKWNERQQRWNSTKVGIVQTNETPSLNKRAAYPGYSYSYPPEMEMTERLSNAGAEIIIWPETQSKQYLDQKSVRKAFSSRMQEMGSSLLFHDIQNHKNPRTGKVQTQSSKAILINEFGKQSSVYQKIKRIPFGEYLPLTSQGTLINRWLKDFFGEFFKELRPGSEHQAMKIPQFNIVPLICYETIFPSFVGNAVKKSAQSLGTTNASVLVALSNDGWFGSTHQPFQHVLPSALRAVENRIPLVHVANNGPSIVVMPTGEITFVSDFQQAAAYIVDVAHPSSTELSFYSRFPMVFERLLQTALLLCLLMALASILKSRRKK